MTPRGKCPWHLVSSLLNQSRPWSPPSPPREGNWVTLEPLVLTGRNWALLGPKPGTWTLLRNGIWAAAASLSRAGSQLPGWLATSRRDASALDNRQLVWFFLPDRSPAALHCTPGLWSARLSAKCAICCRLENLRLYLFFLQSCVSLQVESQQGGSSFLNSFSFGPGARLFGPAYQKGSILPHRHPRHSDFRLISDLEPDKEAKDSIFRNTHHNTFTLGHRSSSSGVAPGFPGSRETDFCCCSPFLAPWPSLLSPAAFLLSFAFLFLRFCNLPLSWWNFFFSFLFTMFSFFLVSLIFPPSPGNLSVSGFN